MDRSSHHSENNRLAQSRMLVAWAIILLLVLCVPLGVWSIFPTQGATGHGSGGAIEIRLDASGNPIVNEWFPAETPIVGEVPFQLSWNIKGGPLGARSLFESWRVEFGYRAKSAAGQFSPQVTEKAIQSAKDYLTGKRERLGGSDNDVFRKMIVSGISEQRKFRREMLPHAVARITAIIGAIGIILLIQRFVTLGRRLRRATEGQCTRCGYDMDGTPSNTCPECGHTPG